MSAAHADRPVPTRMGAGLAAAAVALGATQLLAAFVSPASDARAAVETAVVNLTPGAVKEWAIQTFGTADKLFLSVMVLAAVAALAAVTAIFERSRLPLGSLTIAAAGVVASAAVLARPGATPADVIPTALGTVLGIVVLRMLTRPTVAEPDSQRRRSLIGMAALAGGAVSGVVGVVVSRQLTSVSDDRESFALPEVPSPAPPIPPEVQPKGVALPTFITSNADFYRIDTAMSVPQVSRADWKLRIHGMVDREITYTFTDLERFQAVQSVVTLMCVSNPVGGDLIGNATWTGYRVRDLLRASGIRQDADMVLSTSADGFTAGTPVEALTGDRDSLLAIGMNGVPLPVEHGYPARLVVPGLYGFVSATKWVVDLEVTRFDRAKGYWTKFGWAAEAPIKTGSRIDVPRNGARLSAGPVTLGGVAWAQHRGIRSVEVYIDEGPWQPAQLGAAYSNDTWRLWTFDWQATPGPHGIAVRATDGNGVVQTGQSRSPIPDGATGWHSIFVEVS